jgi:hypothetical protein
LIVSLASGGANEAADDNGVLQDQCRLKPLLDERWPDIAN